MRNDIFFEADIKLSADGLIHTIPVESPNTQRSKVEKRLHNGESKEDAYVCLTCPHEKCAGKSECFRRRKNLLKKRGEI